MTDRVEDFDALECPCCGEPVAPKSVSPGPTVAYKSACGRSWRINADGDETHVRLPRPANDHVGVVGPFIVG